MMPLTEPPPVTHLPVFDLTDDSGVVAMALYAVWAVRTGRTLRHAPISDLTPKELEDFWADDQLTALAGTNGSLRSSRHPR